MPVRQFVVGDPDAPVNGQTKFKAEFLKNVFVDYIIVNNAIENQLSPNPEFTHNYVQGELTRQPFQTGDKLIVVYSNSVKE